LRNLRTKNVEVSTPIATTTGRKVDEPRLILVPILRAGMGMLGAMLDVLPYARVGVLGMQRNEETAEPVPYYVKVPPARDGEELAIVIDPMLATGGSACDALSQLKKLGYRRLVMLSLVAAPEGLAKFESEHPDVPVFVAVKDERLNERFYIVPGLGDAGDRIFGTLQTP
jgi:uracil phosphoribosyltransferase